MCVCGDLPTKALRSSFQGLWGQPKRGGRPHTARRVVLPPILDKGEVTIHELHPAGTAEQPQRRSEQSWARKERDREWKVESGVCVCW